MPRDYLAEFPIPAYLLPQRLRELLTPVSREADERVEVATFFESDSSGAPQEVLQMVMAAVPEENVDSLTVLDEASDGAVMSSVPVLGAKGASKNYAPNVSGFDYIIAAWASGSFRSYHLAEKVWMALGLTPRCLGQDTQRLVYDDLSEPVFDVAEGEVSSEFNFTSSRNTHWRMANAFLRRYLWMRGVVGTRVFFYAVRLPELPELRALMRGESRWVVQPEGGWFLSDLQTHRGGLYLQVWATVAAVSCEQSDEPMADGLMWPDIAVPMTKGIADSMIHGELVFLDDRFLERYEQNSLFESTPWPQGQRWRCNPSYKNQWGFSDCIRVGRNLIQVPLRDLYQAKPDREIVHAHSFALSAAKRAHLNFKEEHIVSKTARLLQELLDLGDSLEALGASVGVNLTAKDWIGLDRSLISAEGWTPYPHLRKLAQVAPLEMTQQAFLARCKTLHELYQRIPAGCLRPLVTKAGCPQDKVKSLGSIKLLQALFNVASKLDAQLEGVEVWTTGSDVEGWDSNSPVLAPLFLNYDLRVSEAHEKWGGTVLNLEKMGFDTASLNQGYGRALDFVFDSVIDAFASINAPLKGLLSRSSSG